MNKILLALTILGAGAGGFFAARQSNTQVQHESKATREVWLTQTQLVAIAHSEQAGLTEHVRQLKETLSQSEPEKENPLWSASQASHAGQLPPELRERFLEELGFNWQSYEDFIVVSKDTVREIHMHAIQHGKLTDIAATVLALTPEERGQVEAATQRVQTDFKDWALAHVERGEPKDDVLAQYTLPGDPAMSQNISNNFASGIFEALGQERAALIMPDVPEFLFAIGIRKAPLTMMVKRSLAENEQRLKVVMFNGTQQQQPNERYGSAWASVSSGGNFPPTFRPIFPNGWADVAKREGFELPEESKEK